MKRHNIELLISWLDALRRRDLPALTERLDPQTTWQGVRPDLVCHGRGAADHAILHARLAEPQRAIDDHANRGLRRPRRGPARRRPIGHPVAQAEPSGSRPAASTRLRDRARLSVAIHGGQPS